MQSVAFKKTQDLSSLYSYWRFRIMISMMVGYAGFYLVRQNFTMIIPFLQSELGYSKTQIGTIISISSLIYGFGKGINGIISDKSNARYFMSLGLFLSSMMNIFMGMSSLLPTLMIIWSLSSVFQSMGWGPCARLLTHWFSAKEIATKWAIWNMSQQIGGAFVLILSTILIERFGWRYVFYVPGILAMGISIFLVLRLRDTPKSLGLPCIEEHHGLKVISISEKLSTKEILFKHVLNNKLVWYVCFANFFRLYSKDVCIQLGSNFFTRI
jgi:sugar phosphate permease